MYPLLVCQCFEPAPVSKFVCVLCGLNGELGGCKIYTGLEAHVSSKLWLLLPSAFHP